MNDLEYENIINLMNGNEQPSPLLIELKKWAKDSMQIEIYNYFCDYAIAGFLRLRLILWNHEVEQKMHKNGNLDPKKQKKIRNKFSELARKYQLHKEYWNENYIFVCYETICEEIRKKIIEENKSKIQSIKHPDIWKIEIIFERIHIFYETDEQIVYNQENGTSAKILERCTEIVKKYDSYNAFKDGIDCTFTSRQTLNEKYDGSMFFYTR